MKKSFTLRTESFREKDCTPEIRDLLLLSKEEVSKITLLKDWKLRQMRKEGTGPFYVKIDGQILYPLEDLRRWLNSRKLRHEAQEHLEAETSKLKELKEEIEEMQRLRQSLICQKRALLLQEESV